MRNFWNENRSMHQTSRFVSRFSSLSGCLNAKLRLIQPGFVPLSRVFFVRAEPGWIGWEVQRQV